MTITPLANGFQYPKFVNFPLIKSIKGKTQHMTLRKALNVGIYPLFIPLSVFYVH